MYLSFAIKLMLCNDAATNPSPFDVSIQHKRAGVVHGYSIARTISSVIFFASPNNIMVLSL